MVRGIERRVIFRDELDRADFVTRLAALVKIGALAIYAWALLPNHAHLLVRTGSRPLPRSMRSLLTGYAGAFNRRHKRVGHLFQNRYKSIVVEEEPYLLELVRYLHLNPLRARLLSDLRALDRYPWTGHSALLGTVPRPWQETATILSQFAPTWRRALHAYRAFVAEGLPQGRRPEFQGGGLVRSLGGWQAVATARRGEALGPSDTRILGGGDFVTAILRESATARAEPPAQVSLETLAARLAASLEVPLPALLGKSQTPAVVVARHLLAHLWVERLGQPASVLARHLGQSRGNVSLAARKGAEYATARPTEIARWCR